MTGTGETAMPGSILIMAAVTEELAGLRNRLHPRRGSRRALKTVARGELGGRPVRLLETGPGVINTARALTAAIEAETPTLVIQTGCAGGFSPPGMAPGDIGIATKEIDAQLGVEIPGTQEVAPLPRSIIPKSAASSGSAYPIDPLRVEKARRVLQGEFAADAVKIVTGPFITVSTITVSDARVRAYCRAYRPIMENMEGAAAAHVCHYYGVPFLEIRSASNRVGCRNKKEWDLPLAFKQASRAVLALVKAAGAGPAGDK